ncbi:putative adhesin [Vagococcus sp. WN89Y]|uniref:putative adhesin n=1 Tax=Vagococcus sp. WN89Y TaxID=3457258 RepID=UPI003FCE6F0A
MPKALSLEHKFLPSDASSHPTNTTYFSPLITELESVNATAGVRSRLLWMPGRACQWLANCLRDKAPSQEKLEWITKARQSRSLEAEQTAFLQQQAQENHARSVCSATGIALGIISAAAVTALGTALLIRRGDGKPGHAMSAQDSPDTAFAQTAALVAPAQVMQPSSELIPVLNATRNDVIARFPGIRPEAVTQLMLTPLIAMLGGSMQGLPADIARQKLSVLVNVLLSTLTTPESLLLYRPDKKPEANIEILKRFIAWQGYPYAIIGSQGFLLRTMPDGTPYVVDNEGRCRFIRFNQKEMCWEFVRETDNQGYSEHNRKWAAKRSRSLTALPAGARMIFDNTEDLITIISPGMPDTPGLFIGGQFIPVMAEEYTGNATKSPKPLAYSACHPDVRHRVIIQSNYGWSFERPTTRMDESLKNLLENRDRCNKIAPRVPVSKIQADSGLNNDNQGRKFLKKGDAYFNVDSLYDPETQKDYLTLTDYPGSHIEYKKGVILLRRAEDMLSPLENIKVKAQLSSTAPFIIERAAIHYLQLNGFTSSAKAINALPFPGLSRGHDHSLIFSVNDDNYVVREYSDKLIRIKNVNTPYQHQSDILLWAAGDTLVRVRYGNTSLFYTNLPFQYPSGQGKLPVVIELEVNQKLQDNIANNSIAVTPDKVNLIEKKRFALPILWSDSRSSYDYFYYNGRYFPATLIDAKESANPAGIDCFTVYAKSNFYSRNSEITTLIIDKKKDRIEIKSLQGYLAENINISKDVAQLYIKKFPWRHNKNIAIAERAGSISGALENYYVAPAPTTRVKKTQSPDAILAAKALYPHRINSAQLTLHKLSDNKFSRSDNEKAIQDTVQNSVRYLKEKILTSLVQNLYYDSPSWKVVKSYLDEATGIPGDEFQSEFAVSLRKRLCRIYNQLKENDIYLVGGKNVELVRMEKIRGPLAYVSPEDGNTYINTHKIDANDKAQIKLTADLIQKTANTTGLAYNIFNTRQNNGMYFPVKDAQALMTRKLAQRKISPEQLKNLQAVSKRYMKNSPAYSTLARQSLTPDIAAYLTRFDPAYRAHLMLNSDNLLTQLSLDTWYLLASARNNATTDSWINTYASLRSMQAKHSKSDELSSPLHIHIPHHHGIKTERRRPENNPKPGEENKPESTRKKPESEQGENSQPESVESRETEYEDLTDSETSLETEYEELTDTDSAESQETEYEELTDSESVQSRETEYDELTDTDVSSETGRADTPGSGSLSRSDTLSLSIPSPIVAPLHPLAPPPIPNTLPAEIAGGLTLGAVGIYLGAAAPEAPAINISPPRGNETVTTSSPAKSDEPITEVIPHEIHRKFFRRPQEQTKNSGRPYFPDSHDDVFLPEERVGSGRGKEGKVLVPGHGEVTSIVIPELECLGDKDVSFTKVLRWAGQTLQFPVSKNAEAWQEIYHIDYLGGDCPTPEDAEWLQTITVPIDVAINTALSFAKPFAPVTVLQNLVGPWLEFTADVADGKNLKEIGGEQLTNLFLQTLGYMRVDLATFKGPKTPAYLLKKTFSSKANPFYTIFKNINAGRRYINIKGREYPFKTTYDEVPIFHDDTGKTNFINFNPHNEKWELINPDGIKIKNEAKKYQDIHKIRLSDMVKNRDITMDNNGIYTIQLANNEQMTGVYTGMDFIPATEYKIGKDIVAYTINNDRTGGIGRLLVQGTYGWKFERKSVEIDEQLQILLDSKYAGNEADQIKFGPIQDEGLSYDAYHNAYIKYNHAYYNVDTKNPNTASGEVTLPEYEDAVIKFENNRFTLVRHEDTLFASKMLSIADKEKPFYMEKGGWEFLDTYGKEVSHSLPDHVGPGLYSDLARKNTVFALNGHYFTVSRYSTDEMNIMTYGGKSTIDYWYDNDTWLRIRSEPEEPAFDFEELAFCRRARAPGRGACSGIIMEAGLRRHLERQLEEEMSSDRVPPAAKLHAVRYDDIPYLYQDLETNQFYFNHDNEYFNAEIIEASNKMENPTGFPCLKLTGRSDFNNMEKKIATIVITRIDGRIKIVDLPTFIAEKLNISKEEASLYLKKRPFRKLSYINDLEQLSTDLAQSDELYVSQPPPVSEAASRKFNSATLRRAAAQALFPEHIIRDQKYRIAIYDSKELTSRHSDYIREGIESANRKIDYLKEVMLPRVIDSLNPESHDHPIVEDYLIQALKKDSPNFLADIENSVSSRLKMVQEDLNRRSFKLLSVFDLTDSTNPRYVRALGNLIYIHPDEPHHMYINLDLTDVGNNANEVALKELTGAILAESLRSTKAATIAWELPRDEGIFININDAWTFLKDKIRLARRNEALSHRLHETIAEYVRKSPLYQHYQDKLADISVDSRTFDYLVDTDPGIRAQIMLNSEEFMTLITQDLHYLTSISDHDSSILHPWVRRYGQRRGVMSAQEDKAEMTDFIISPDDETPSLHTKRVTASLLQDIPGYRNIFKTPDDRILLRKGHAFYSAEFLGKTDKLIVLGEPENIQQVYYYDPRSGNIKPIREPYSRINILKYCREADLYESISPGFDFSEVLRFDESLGKLVPTGATHLARLPGKVVRIEYPSFNLYHPQGASHDIFILGHGQNLAGKSKLPDNIYVTWYTAKGQALFPYKGNADDFLSGKLFPAEAYAPGEEVDDYAITAFEDAKINHYHMAKQYNKNIVQLFPSSTHSSDLIESIAKLYPEGEVDLHYYTCRTPDKNPISPSDPVVADPQISDTQRKFCTRQPTARWTFDQQVEAYPLKADQKLRNFLPLGEVTSYFHFDTVEKLIRQSIEHYYYHQPYDIFYGLEAGPQASMHAPGYINKPRAQLITNIWKAKTSINKALSKINNKTYNTRIRDYLSYAFDTTNDEVLKEVTERLRLMIRRVHDFLDESGDMDYSNFAIVSTRQTADEHIPGIWHSTIDNKHYRSTLPSAFVMPGDAYRRVFILNDSYFPLTSKEAGVDYKDMNQEHMILHETSHIVGETLDIQYVKLVPEDFANKEFNIVDAQRGLKYINRLLTREDIRTNALWREFLPIMKKYYKFEKTPDDFTIRKMFHDDPMLKANLITSNADSFAIFVKHLANLEISDRRKRENSDPISEADYKHLALFFSLVQGHNIHNIE